MIERYSRKNMSSIWSDENKFNIWQNIEILACEANHKLGLIPRKALYNIKKKARFNVKRIQEIEDNVKHDVIAFLTNLSENIGPDSRFIHLGMTSSDILDTTLAYQMKQAGIILLDDLKKISNTLKHQAKKYKYTPMIGRTHGVHAELITLGLKFALWFDETQRNIKRLENATEVISVGQISGAVGTYEHISPKVEKYVCKKMGLKNTKISNQILQRDRHSEYLNTLAIIASCSEKYTTEIRQLQKTETLELEEPFSKNQKGSSAMPHKKNPVLCERLSGLARVLRGNALAGMENIILWHERDISHSSVERIIIPDSTMLLDYILYNLNNILKNLIVNEQNINRNIELTRGLIFSQRVLLKLIEKGMKRETAYKCVQDNSMKCWKSKEKFLSVLKKDKTIVSHLNNKELQELFDYKKSNKMIEYIYRRVGI